MDALLPILQSLPSLGGATAEHVLAWISVGFTLLAFLGWGLDRALPRMRAAAAKTKTKTDDKVVNWLERAAAVLGLLNVIVPRPRFGSRTPEAPPPSEPGSGGGGAPLIPLALALAIGFSVLASASMTGCGASQWDVHAAAAQVSNETAVTGRSIILGERRRVLLEAGRGAADIAAAVRAAAATWDVDNRVLVEAYNVFASVANQYASSAFAALRGEADDLSELVRLAGRVADAWNAVAAILDATDVTDQLPRIPDWLLRFLSGDSSAQPEGLGS